MTQEYIAGLLKINKQLYDALKNVEWIDANTHTDGTGYDCHYRCPWCWNDYKIGHAQDCIREAALKAAEGEATE